jgi:hypothetical protein
MIFFFFLGKKSKYIKNKRKDTETGGALNLTRLKSQRKYIVNQQPGTTTLKNLTIQTLIPCATQRTRVRARNQVTKKGEE